MRKTNTNENTNGGASRRRKANEASAQPVEALAVSIAEASRITGISRSELYRRLAAKQICAVKSGTRTLILMTSLRQHLASLPPATFRPTQLSNARST